MSRSIANHLVVLLLFCCVVGCGPPPDKIVFPKPKKGEKFEPTAVILENGEASHITVQHCLIGFQGSMDGKPVTRSKADAEKLANEIFEKAKAGEEFGALVEKYTDDAAPGIYRMANFDQQSHMPQGAPVEDLVFARDGMVPAFGDTGFPLEVGGIGMAEYHRTKSPYGWHIVKRLK